MNSVFSLLYCTCDSYVDLSDNFFLLLKKYWPEFNDSVFFNSDSVFYANDYYQIINVPHSRKGISWSQRLFDSLKMIKTEYVVIFLDDFYLEARVDNDEFNKCLMYMSNHKDVNSIVFTMEPGIKNTNIPELGDFAYRKHFSMYKITAHISIYRTDFLRKILKRNESAWEFEVNGTVRSFFMRGKFICKTNKNFTFPYHYGLLVTQGKYNKELKTHFEKEEGLIFRVVRPYVVEEKTYSTKKRPRLGKLAYLFRAFASFFGKRPV